VPGVYRGEVLKSKSKLGVPTLKVGPGSCPLQRTSFFCLAGHSGSHLAAIQCGHSPNQPIPSVPSEHNTNGICSMQSTSVQCQFANKSNNYSKPTMGGQWCQWA